MQQTIKGTPVEEFKQTIINSASYGEAAAKLNVHIKTVIRWAAELDCRKQGNSGGGDKHYSLDDIFAGKHPQYQSNNLKKRLIREGIKTNECEKCGITEWMDQPIKIELDHINGDRHDHRLENLRMLCPNCHSQTDTFKNKKRI